MEEKNEKIEGNKQDFLFDLHPKVSAYCSLKVLDVNKKTLVHPNYFLMFSIQGNRC